MKRLIALIKSDFKSIFRDPLLIISVAVPILLGLFIKLLLPMGAQILQQKLNFDLTQHYPLIMSFLLPLTPMMIGVLTGFILLDDRDENILAYIAITPLPRSSYLLYRLISPVVSSTIMNYLLLWLASPVPINYLLISPIVLLCAIEAPLLALFLVNFAANKVEGLALSKAMGIFMVAPIAAYFIKSNFQLLLGVAPPYWISKAFLNSYTFGLQYLYYIVGGIVVHGIYLYLSLNRFRTKMP
jgi:fluoroquinolone transport system permease protein